MQIKAKIVFKFNVQFEFFVKIIARRTTKKKPERVREKEKKKIHSKFVHVETAWYNYNTFALITHLRCDVV